MKLKIPTRQDQQAGFILPTLMTFIVVALIISAAVVEIINSNLSLVNNNVKHQQAFNIAEAGINYYLWHLSHNATDFKDGQSTPASPDPQLGYGPYVHNYIDSNAVNEGTYTLWIKPQGTGSTIATVRSIGKVTGTNFTRTVEASIGRASFASYAVVGDSALWFGNNETANGPVFSNQGIRLDGPNTDIAGSANSTYVPPYQVGGDGASHPGVWCSTSVTQPVNCATRNKSTWLYPKPAIDFNQVSSSLCTMKKTAFADFAATASLATQANACTQTPTTRTGAYIPQRSSSFSLTIGYLIQLNPNGTYDLFNVNSETDTAATYSSALGLQVVATGIAIPPSGVIFTEDNVWVRSNPTFQGRVTIGAGRLATTRNANIVIADDLLYSTKNGSDAIGLVAEGDVLIAPYAPPASGAFTFEIDAAIISQSGNVLFPPSYRSSYLNTPGWVNPDQQMVFYGSVATRQTWTWNWITSSDPNAVYDPVSGYYFSGIVKTTSQYDYNLLYAPPPSYPLTSSYNILSWREVLVAP